MYLNTIYIKVILIYFKTNEINSNLHCVANSKQSIRKERTNGMKCEFNFTVGRPLNDKGVCGCVVGISQIQSFLNVIVVSHHITSITAYPVGLHDFILTKFLLHFLWKLIKCQSPCWLSWTRCILLLLASLWNVRTTLRFIMTWHPHTRSFY